MVPERMWEHIKGRTKSARMHRKIYTALHRVFIIFNVVFSRLMQLLLLRLIDLFHFKTQTVMAVSVLPCHAPPASTPPWLLRSSLLKQCLCRRGSLHLSQGFFFFFFFPVESR